MRGHGAHIWMCAAVLLAALVIVLATGNAFFIIPALGCMLMMGAMMWMMMGGMGDRGAGSDRSDGS